MKHRNMYALLVMGLFLIGNSSFASGVEEFNSSSTTKDWDVDLTLSGRVLTSVGTGIDKDNRTEDRVGYGGSFRIRPGVFATNGKFVFNFQIGTDVYLGGINVDAGSNKLGYAMGSNILAALQLRRMSLGYKWDNGIYTLWGVQDGSIPYINSTDGVSGITAGWSNNSGIDITAFYFMAYEGDIYKSLDDSGLFGVKATLAPFEGFSITPFVVGLWQGSKYMANHILAGGQQIGAMDGYGLGAKFVDGVGLYAGFDMSYQSSFGMYTNLMVAYAYGDNNAYKNGLNGGRYDQTRNAFGALLTVGYKLEEMIDTSLFFDIRSGSKNIEKDGTNYSFNGAVIEYDESTPPLLILYNAGTGRQGFQYSDAMPDGFAFSDRGAYTLGLDAKIDLAAFNIGIVAGNTWYAASRTDSSNVGFELDLYLSYMMEKDTSLYLETGVLFAGEGLKQEMLKEKGGKTFNAQNPWVLNAGIKYNI